MDENRAKRLAQAIGPQVEGMYPLRTRVHPVSYSGLPINTTLWVKREDETGFGISGSKFRKYASLLPFLRKHGFRRVILLGGAHSNNVLGLSQLLIENGIEPLALLRGEESLPPKGNHLLSRLLLGDCIRYIPRSEWPQAEALAQAQAEALREQGHKTFIMAEGASVNPSLPGACTLALDILRNERELGRSFGHIWVDAGTGMTAAILAASLSWLEHPAKLSIVTLAEDENGLRPVLPRWHKQLEQLLGKTFPALPPDRLQILPPTLAPAFGKVDTDVLAFVRDFARESGILTDPVYSAKFFATALAETRRQPPGGEVLLIHSGGAQGLLGFSKEISALIA